MLVDECGMRFMPAVHKDAELAPRDVVARAIHRELANGHKVFLDCREAIGTEFPKRFPTVYAACRRGDVDPVRQPIPVAPAAHYHMGGLASDDRGRSSLEGLWAVGECAATGLHGANRLAFETCRWKRSYSERARQKTFETPSWQERVAVRHLRRSVSQPPRRRMFCAMP